MNYSKYFQNGRPQHLTSQQRLSFPIATTRMPRRALFKRKNRVENNSEHRIAKIYPHSLRQRKMGPPKMRKLRKKRKHCASATSLWKTLRKPRPQLPRHLQGQSCQLLDIFLIFGFFLRLYTLENDKK